MALQIEDTVVSKLIPYAKNARTHSEEQVEQIASSIKEFGFVNPILVGKDNVVIAGHGRLLAAQKLGLKSVPVIKLEYLTESQQRALVIADNRIADNAGWDEVLLQTELQALETEDFDLETLGFDDTELEALLHPVVEGETAHLDENVPEPEENPVSKTGDIWLLGEHRLLCGDGTLEEDMKTLMGEDLADMVFTDPPYGVNCEASEENRIRLHGKTHAARKMKNDTLGKGFEEFLAKACETILEVTDGSVYICMSSSRLDVLRKAFCDGGGKWSTYIVWAKQKFVIGRSDYHQQYEIIFYTAGKQGMKHYWCGARNESNLWFHR